MPVESKSELRAATAKEFSKLETLIGSIDPELAMLKDDEDTSIKDVIGHRAHWIALFFQWYDAGLSGNEVFFPAKGYKWSQLNEYNADLRARQTGVDWEGAKRLLSEQHVRLVGFIDRHTDLDLYGGPMKGANNNWTPGRWAEAAGPSHYRSASKYIRKRLKSLR